MSPENKAAPHGDETEGADNKTKRAQVYQIAVATAPPRRPAKRGGWFALFADAFLAELARISLEAGGAYARLLAVYWLCGPLADDDRTLAQLSGAGRRWKALRPELTELFVIEGGVWKHAHLDFERARFERRSAEQSARARKRWEPKP